jgi:transcriptional regulator with XRE-family HTH domain
MYYRDEKFIKKFGANLKKVRKAKGISQEQLANELGFSQPHIVKIELGQVNTSISHIAAIAKVLKIHASELFQFD